MTQIILKYANYLFVLLFILSLSINYLQQTTKFFSDLSSTERRILATCPNIYKDPKTDTDDYYKKLLAFPAGFNLCFPDQFVLRNTIMQNLNSFRLNNLNTTTNPHVIIGQNGWYEYYNPSIQSYIKKSFEPWEIELWYKKLLARQDYYNSKGIKYYVFIAPIKSTLLPEYFPSIKALSDSNGAKELEKFNKQNGGQLNLNLFHSVLDQEPEQYFFKSDFHWNLEGAYEAYKIIYKTLIKDGVRMQKIDKSNCQKEFVPLFEGDLAFNLGITEIDRQKIADINITHYLCYKQAAVFNKMIDIYGNTPIKTFDLEQYEFDSLIMMRDSFAMYTAPFIVPSFNKVKMVYSPSAFEYNSFELIEENKPDVVIQMLTETNMRRNIIENNEFIDHFENS